MVSGLKKFFRRRIYLDYAAATPVAPEVLKSMAPYASTHFGNASSVHEEGREARRAIESARGVAARIFHTRTDEIFFTSGGTEGNNVAIQGTLNALLASVRSGEECEVITTALEHPSILAIIPMLEAKGVRVRIAPVDAEGRIDMAVFPRLLSLKTVLITFAYAQSEIGVVQDVKRITHLVRQHKAEHATSLPYVHIDASQAPLYLPCAVDSLGVDLMTVDAAKFHGPKGVGILIKKHGVSLMPLMSGGGQEEGLRPGTEPTALIVGCAAALVRAEAEREARNSRIKELREYGFGQLQKEISGVVINGSREHRLSNNIHISIPGIDGEYAVVVLDVADIAVSTKSACSGASGTGSNAIYALGGDDARAFSTIRATLGESTKKKDIDVFVRTLARHVAHMREAIDQLVKK